MGDIRAFSAFYVKATHENLYPKPKMDTSIKEINLHTKLKVKARRIKSIRDSTWTNDITWIICISDGKFLPYKSILLSW